MLEYQNIKILLRKVIFQIGLKKFLLLKKLKILCREHVISDLNREEILGTFYIKELQKTNQIESRVEKVIKRKDNKLYVKRKGYNSSCNSWIEKKIHNINE